VRGDAGTRSGWMGSRWISQLKTRRCLSRADEVGTGQQVGRLVGGGHWAALGSVAGLPVLVRWESEGESPSTAARGQRQWQRLCVPTTLFLPGPLRPLLCAEVGSLMHHWGLFWLGGAALDREARGNRQNSCTNKTGLNGVCRARLGQGQSHHCPPAPSSALQRQHSCSNLRLSLATSA
jgi:hypothetical protein